MKNEEKTEIIELSEETIQNRIYNIRGEKVMLDFDLAEIYGYETRTFNQQVSNNIEKFDDDFMFQLTKEEFENLMSKKLTSSWGGRRKLPHAFTEQGIYMLMTVLKGDLAVKQSKALIRLFKSMKDYIAENRLFIPQKEFVKLALQVEQNTSDINEMKENITAKSDFQKIMDNFIDPDQYKHFLILNGQKLEADAAYTKIYRQAKNSIFVIDNYIGLKTLELRRSAGKGVGITIFSDNIGGRDKLTKSIFLDFQSDCPTSAFPSEQSEIKHTTDTSCLITAFQPKKYSTAELLPRMPEN